ncbi:DUF1189 family protein [Effusibacillus consociatus]|uniref:DUF1189 family protein n=1 Tax=Effusibacillus consociatus TaxID=1117041 RepID=A0ABV9PYA0_9BACL
MNTIWNSIRKPSLYKEMTQRPLWRLVLTLLLFFMLVTAIQTFSMAKVMNPFLTFMEKEFPAKMPSFTYDGNELRVDAATPLTLTSRDGYHVIVDVSAPYPKDSINQITSGVVIGKTELYIIERGVQPIPYKQVAIFPLANGTVITKDLVIQITPWLKPVFIVFLVLFSFVLIAWTFIQITIFSFIASVLASSRKIRLNYRQAWLISAFAFVPAALIDLLNFYLRSPYVGLAFWVAVFTYIYHGVGSFSERSGLD